MTVTGLCVWSVTTGETLRRLSDSHRVVSGGWSVTTFLKTRSSGHPQLMSTKSISMFS